MQMNTTIKPNSKHREEVMLNDDGGFTVFTKAPAVDGKANEAAANLIAKHFSVSKSRVSLVRGHTSRRKVFEVNIDG